MWGQQSPMVAEVSGLPHPVLSPYHGPAGIFCRLLPSIRPPSTALPLCRSRGMPTPSSSMRSSPSRWILQPWRRRACGFRCLASMKMSGMWARGWWSWSCLSSTSRYSPSAAGSTCRTRTRSVCPPSRARMASRVYTLDEGIHCPQNSLSASIFRRLGQLVKNLPATQETPVQFLGQEDPLEGNRLPTPVFLDFTCGSAGKESTCTYDSY